MRALWLLIFLFGFIAHGPAQAKENADSFTVCRNTEGNYSFQAIVDACRSLIASTDDIETRSEAHNMLGIAYGDHADFERALEEFSAAIRLRPDAESAPYTNRGIAHRNLGHFEEALADYENALRINPRSSRALNNRCWARAVTGRDLQLAIEDCTTSLAIQADPNTNGTRCLAYLHLANYRSAFDDCQAAYVGDPRSARALYGRGLANKGLGRSEQAARDMHAALEMDANVAAEYASYGIAPPTE